MHAPLTQEDLDQHTHVSNAYSHHMFDDILYSEGANMLVTKANAYWLIDQIIMAQLEYHMQPYYLAYQTWTLESNEDNRGALSCVVAGEEVYRKRYDTYTFPLDKVVLIHENDVVMLPSEHPLA